MAGFDPAQSPLLDNCNLIAAISACGWTKKGAWFKNVAANEPVADSYNLQFYDYNNKNVPVVSPKKYLPQNPEGTLLYGKSTTDTECWPGIIEKGYYMARDRLRGIDSNTPDMEYYNDVKINPTKDPGTVLFQLLNVEPVRRSTAINGSDYKEALVWNDMNMLSALGDLLTGELFVLRSHSRSRTARSSPPSIHIPFSARQEPMRITPGQASISCYGIRGI